VPLNAIYFRLYANASTYGGTLTVSDVEVNDQPVPTRILESDTVLALALPQPLPPDNVAVIDMGFRTLVPRDSQVHYQIFNYEKGIGAFSNFYPTLAVYDQQGWDIDPILTQGDSTYCAISFYEVNLTAPSDTKLVTSGTQIDHASNGDGTAMWRFVTGPIRDFGLAVSTAYEMAEQELGPIRVRSFYLPQDQAGGKKLLEHARDALEAYQQQLGPYPYNEFDVAEAPIGAGGMELPGMTLIQIDHYDRTDGYDEFVVAHEVAHQWWYNLVGNDQQEAPWIDEGLTNYCAVIYYEETYQQQEGEQWLTWYLRDPYNRAVDAGLDKPAVLPVSAYDGVVYYRIVYAKAGLFYHALRQRLGDAQFFRLLGEYLEIYKYDRVTTDEVLDFWRQRANQDISDLIERWLLTPRS
jgi:aminopeptidase N